jgi:hypothetical protein
MINKPSLQSMDIPVVVAMKNAHVYWLQHKEEISDFDFKDWCRNRWGFTWAGNPGLGNFAFKTVNQEKYTEFMLTWQ